MTNENESIVACNGYDVPSNIWDEYQEELAINDTFTRVSLLHDSIDNSYHIMINASNNDLSHYAIVAEDFGMVD